MKEIGELRVKHFNLKTIGRGLNYVALLVIKNYV